MLLSLCLLLVLTVGCCTNSPPFETKTVDVGSKVTLSCPRLKTFESGAVLFWIRLVSGNFPEALGGTWDFNYVGVNKTPHFTTKQGPGTFLLQIHETNLSDTGVYYCLKTKQFQMTFLAGTFLRVKGPGPGVTTVHQFPLPGPVRPGDSVTLQCSVVSDSERKTCPGDLGVFWFKAGQVKSHPSVIYTHGNHHDECVKSPEVQSPQRCFYNFTQTVSYSDAGTYYCAVASCGEILFGNGEKLDIDDDSSSDSQMSYTTFLLVFALALSLIFNAVLLCGVRKNVCVCPNANGNQQSQQRSDDSLVYTAPTFTKREAAQSNRRNEPEEEMIYSDVRTH